jgi:DNA-binding MarR family transcriptional regulator
MKESEGNPAPPALQLLEFFYPIHYRIGMAMEEALGDGRLTRKQVAILWLIRSEGGRQRGVPRKRIERLLSNWYEVSSPTVTRALRAMARRPLGLVRFTEHPQSAREKQVWLTARGERFLQEMVERGTEFIAGLARHFSEQELRLAITFFRRASVLMTEPPNGA